VFNPVLQSKRFDREGEYIARWLPELAALPAALRHEPWLDKALLAKVAPHYPRMPLIDLAASRSAALQAYRG
jgi:deoxyribodipyrimidine photo-lyase